MRRPPFEPLEPAEPLLHVPRVNPNPFFMVNYKIS